MTTLAERDVAKACDELAEKCGWTVERYEQRRVSRICEGLPDRRYVHRGRSLRVWVELKPPGGKMTLAQHTWLIAEIDTGAHAICVDSVHVLEHLFRLLSRDAGRGAALQYCAQTTKLVASKGYRRAA